MVTVSKDHPRYKSLVLRDKLVDGCKRGITSVHGLIAHGRGEAFDYFIGEKSTTNALDATEVASAYILTAQRPILSVNGNVAALVPAELVELSEITEAPLEINLYHRSRQRSEKIEQHLRDFGARRILTGRDYVQLPGIASERAKVDQKGIFLSDVVFMPLEDGDRCEALKKSGKMVLAVDLNPLSRTALAASVTVVDELTRTMGNLIEFTRRMQHAGDKEELEVLKSKFDNAQNLKTSYSIILSRLQNLSESKGL
ncbi:MAG: phosphopantothenate/pantothenate synthetase [Halobacteriota archaeon]